MTAPGAIPPFRPEDAFIVIDPTTGKRTVDATKYILGVLMRDWNPKNTDGIKPLFNFAELTKDIQFGSNDWCVIYTNAEIQDPHLVGYTHESIHISFSLDMFTSRDRAHVVKMGKEAERILKDVRKDTFGSGNIVSGRQWIEIQRITPFDKTSKRFYRRIIDAELHWIYRLIE